MKVSKVNHIKTAVSQKSGSESTGFLYVDPSKEQKKSNTEKHVKNRVEMAKRAHDRMGDKGAGYVAGEKRKQNNGRDKYAITGKYAAKSIDNQNLIVQPNPSGKLVLSEIKGAVETDKKERDNRRDKDALRLFLNDYADLDENVRMDMLRKIRRLVDLFFYGLDKKAESEASDGKSECMYDFRFDEIPQESDFDVWKDHKKKGDKTENYIEFNFRNENEGNKNNSKEDRDKKIKELRYKIRGEGIYRYTNAVRLINENKELKSILFEDVYTNKYWVGHIQREIERIFDLKLNATSKYKLRIGWVSEKVWKGIINFLCQKYIAMGKAVYHTAMSGILEGKTDDIGIIAENYKDGISSFDYERIKAEETLQLDTSMYVAFAINHFANATVEIPDVKGKEDVLGWEEKDFTQYSKEGTVKAILQFFGGASQWEEFSDIKILTNQEFWTCFREILASVRNENFHFATANKNSGSWNTEFVGEMFAFDAGRFSQVQVNKFYSNNYPMFYAVESLKPIISDMYKCVNERNTQVPSFNSVFVRKNFASDLVEVFNFKPDVGMTQDQVDKWQHCLYFLFKEVYYNMFLQSEDSLNLVYEAVNNGLKGDNPKAKDDFIRRINELKPFDYSLSELCQIISTERNQQNHGRMKKQSAYASQKNPESYQHYRVFLFQALKGAFGKFIDKNEQFSFLKSPMIREMCDADGFLSDVKISKYDELVDKVKKTAELQKWYVVTRLLSPKQANMLVGSMRHYKQFLFDVVRRAKETGNALSDNDKEMGSLISDITAVMDMCIGLSGSTSNEISDYFEDKEDYAEYVSRFLDFYKKNDDVVSYCMQLSGFCNSNLEGEQIGIFYDGKNPILNRNILITKLYGASSIVTDIINKDGQDYDSRVREKDIQKLRKLEMDIQDYRLSGICKTKEDQKKLKEYQNIKNHVEFRDIEELSEILDELQGRLIKWVYFRERDLMYYQLGFHYCCLHNDKCTKPELYCNLEMNDKSIRNAILYQIVAMYINGLPVYYLNDNKWIGSEKANKSAGAKIGNFFKYTSNCAFDDKEILYKSGLELFEVVSEHDDIIGFRNYIEHFKFYSRRDRSMLSMFSEIFECFFTHDMKFRKNAVNLLYNILLGHFVKSEFEFGSDEQGHHVRLNLRKNGRGLSSDEFTYNIGDKKKQTMNCPARNKQFLDSVARLLYYPEQVPNEVVQDPNTIKIKVSDKSSEKIFKGNGKKGNRGGTNNYRGGYKNDSGNRNKKDKSESEGFSIGGAFANIDIDSLPKG